MEQIGEYIVRRLVGEGGMGKVYEAEERLSKRRVALKVLHPELAKSEQGRKLFTNEMQILAHLEHPNIVRSLASVEVDGQLVMVLEYLEGQTLRRVIAERGPLPWTEAIAVIRSASLALSAAHSQEPPIIHRDLKPENIMVLGDGSVKVMDFGIAKVIEALNQTNTQSVGTLQYMSPEQIDAHTIDHRSDLYCLGLILYELLSGHPPFQSASPRQLLNQQCTQEPPPLPEDVRRGMPRGVEQLLLQLLEKAPEDRPYFADEVAERLEPFLAAEHVPLSRGAAPARSATSLPGADRSSRPTPDRAPSLPDAPATAPEVSGRRSSDDVSSPGVAAPNRDAAAPMPRADTLALVDKIERKRDVPTLWAVAIIVVLSVLAGVGGYLAKIATADGDGPSPSKTATRPKRSR